MKKTLAKVLAIALCAVLLVTGTVYITLAYLQSQTEVVTNTFTTSNISLELDEAKVDAEGQIDPSATGRVKNNDYHLIPGNSYAKDPTVHVIKGSEPCYVVIAIHNTLFSETIKDTDYEGNGTIAQQMATNGWSPLNSEGTNYKISETLFPEDSNAAMYDWVARDGEGKITSHDYTLYYYTGTQSENGVVTVGTEKNIDLVIFEGFTLDINVDKEELNDLQNPTFEIVAFAMQTTNYGGNFDTLEGVAKIGYAFDATFGANAQ